VYRTVPFVYLFILGTGAVLSVIGVRTVPLMYISGNRYTITLGYRNDLKKYKPSHFEKYFESAGRLKS